jgi:hypothetical protein
VLIDPEPLLPTRRYRVMCHNATLIESAVSLRHRDAGPLSQEPSARHFPCEPDDASVFPNV